eukprot:4140956-Amphidinium_carterae.1
MHTLFSFLLSVYTWGASPCRGNKKQTYTLAFLGQFLADIEKIYTREGAELVLVLADICREDAILAECIQQYNIGRAHVLFTLSVKFAAFQEPPLLILAASHHNPSVARRALRVCLESTCTHPAIVKLHTEHIESEATSFVTGTDLQDLPALHAYIASFYFGFLSERQVEGGHSIVHMRSIKARHRTEAYDSLTLRLASMKQSIQADPAML